LFGIDPNAVVVGTATPGSPANVTLDSTLYYTIFVADEFNNIDSTYTLILSGSGALPVELISFNFNVQNDGILLNWKTGTELNNYGFEIERINESETEDWKSISFINGNGTTNTPKEYFFFDERPPVGNLSYRLKQIDNNGSFEYSKSISVNIENPSSFKLFQNYPNPFNPATEIRFALNESDFVTLKVFDVQGNEVKNLVNGRKEAGIHRINFNAADISSGIYFYSIKTSSFSQTKKMMLIK
jgi:hypothetical protein